MRSPPAHMRSKTWGCGCCATCVRRRAVSVHAVEQAVAPPTGELFDWYHVRHRRRNRADVVVIDPEA